MHISQDAYNHYWEKGWVAIEDVYSPDEVERIAQIAIEVSDRDMKQAMDPDEAADKGVGYAVDRAEDGSIAPRKINAPFLKEPDFQSFVLDARLSRRIKDLIGVEPVLVTDQIFMKPPHFGSAKPYHQDNYYFKCDPADHVITAWIAMDNVDESNGCLRYIEGSHKGPVLPHETPDPDEPYNLVPPPELIDLSKEALRKSTKAVLSFTTVRRCIHLIVTNLTAGGVVTRHIGRARKQRVKSIQSRTVIFSETIFREPSKP